jgi:Cof subfamily protein (haloacid dehalogenase superfamily)
VTREIRLVVSDVDGTLLDPNKELSSANREAVHQLRDACIQFAMVSSRPVRGLEWLLAELNVEAPCAGFNGGLVVRPDLSVIEEKDLPAGLIPEIVNVIAAHKLDVWLYTRDLWLVSQLDGLHVRNDANAVRFSPELFRGFSTVNLKSIIKVVAVGDRYDDITACESSLQDGFGNQLSATRSRVHYLDITHPDANKGTAIEAIAKFLQIPLENVATIGDAENDVLMFRKSGMSIAMGQALPEVHREALHMTTSNSEDGFFWAIRHFVLGKHPDA